MIVLSDLFSVDFNRPSTEKVLAIDSCHNHQLRHSGQENPSQQKELQTGSSHNRRSFRQIVTLNLLRAEISSGLIAAVFPFAWNSSDIPHSILSKTI
jgi:hypothetical protein